MGRNIKEGLSYFPLEVDFFEDEKVQFVSARFGVKGDGIIVRILCKIYRQGYAIKFDDDVALLFARSVGDINLHGLVKDVVNELLKRDFFDEGIFERFGLLTSKGIQKRYTKICKDAKRLDHQIRPEIDLLATKVSFPTVEIEETPVEIIQRKEKESKEKKSKELVGQAHTPDQVASLIKFKNWLTEHAARVYQFKEPLTDDQILRLKEDFKGEIVQVVLTAIQNRADVLKKNVSANLTIRRWIKNDFGNDKIIATSAGPTSSELKSKRILEEIR